jgi:predicted 3-demethylubiquinone-9 3-methyltransferase (glyoxalase superfamily)
VDERIAEGAKIIAARAERELEALVAISTPSGDVDLLSIELSGYELALISAGPLFKFNPSISFLVACATKEEVDSLWKELSNGGTALMELGSYPFSERYGWIQDRYGVSWQLMYGQRQGITPVMMFTQGADGKCEEAIRFYTSVFRDSSTGQMMHRDNGTVQFGQRNWEPVMITADWTSPRRPAAITSDAAWTSATVPRTMSPSNIATPSTSL